MKLKLLLAFTLLAGIVSAQTNLVSYEYWFNNDYANVQSFEVAPTQSHELNTNIDISYLPDYVNVFNIRYKDQKGRYSSVFSRIFIKLPNSQETDNMLRDYLYWYDDDYANAVSVTLPENVQIYNWVEMLSFPIDMAGGDHDVNVRFRDSYGMWSAPFVKSFFKNYYPRAEFDGVESELCFGTLLEIKPINAIDVDSIYWDFGDGSPILAKNDTTTVQHLYDDVGTYSIKVSMKHFESGISNDTTFAITIHPTYGSVGDNVSDVIPEINLSVCESELPYIFGTQSLTESGTYTELFQTIHGCDSTVTLNLTINNVDISVTKTDELTLKANAENATYQWVDCNDNNAPIEGETNQSFTAIKNGRYAVIVTQNNCTDTSACYDITTVGILENMFDNKISVYPNPTDGIIKVDLGETLPEFIVSIKDISGKILKQSAYKNIKILELNLDVQPGIYLLTINSENKRATIRLIKN